MISTILKNQWLHLKRDYVALGLTFVLPIVFFSIFAMIFGGMSGELSEPEEATMDVLVVDDDDTELSERFIEALGKQGSVTVHLTPRATEEDPDPAAFTREEARKSVRRGDAPAAVVIPEGFGESFGTFTGGAGEPVEIIYDAANPMVRPMLGGVLQATAFTAAPDLLMDRGLGMLETFGGGLTAEQDSAVEYIRPYLKGEKSWEEVRGTPGDDEDTAGEGRPTASLIRIEATDARAEDAMEENAQDDGPQMVAYYAAGIGVMFLLFSMAGAGGSLLDEEESGTLERVLTSNTSMTTVLLGKWLFFGLMGILQVIIMFLWGKLFFGLDLFSANRPAGFLAMTVVTGAAASAFGILLATACRSRAQLGGISTIVILVMSALGGSMVPRFVMPSFMDTTALFTFNGWALDGYLKVFWHDDPSAGLGQALASLGPQLLALAGMAVVFLLAARVLARRWETV